MEINGVLAEHEKIQPFLELYSLASLHIMDIIQS